MTTTTSTTPAVQMITCACGCGESKPAEQMRVPNWDALKQANAGKRVAMADLAKFALTGKCSHQMKEKTGVKCFPYLAAVSSAIKAEQERAEAARKQAEEARKVAEQKKAQNSFFQKFVTPKNTGGGRKAGGRAIPLSPRSADGRNVGGGLSRLAEQDAIAGGRRPVVAAPDGVQ